MQAIDLSVFVFVNIKNGNAKMIRYQWVNKPSKTRMRERARRYAETNTLIPCIVIREDARSISVKTGERNPNGSLKIFHMPASYCHLSDDATGLWVPNWLAKKTGFWNRLHESFFEDDATAGQQGEASDA